MIERSSLRHTDAKARWPLSLSGGGVYCPPTLSDHYKIPSHLRTRWILVQLQRKVEDCDSEKSERDSAASLAASTG